VVPTKRCLVCGRLFEKPKTVSMRTWVEERKCCSRECGIAIRRGRSNPKLGDATRGKKQPPEVVAKRAASIRRTYESGNVNHARANKGLRREQTTQWKGDDIGYRAAHARLSALRGKASEHRCDMCGGPAHEWALRDDARAAKVAVGGQFDGKSFSTQVDDYMPACRPCHRIYDGRERDPRSGRYI
jgi:hypothetical protein